MRPPLVAAERRLGRIETPSTDAAAAATTAQALGGAGAIVLAIIGIAGGKPPTLMAIGTIVLGGAMLMNAAALGARYERLVPSSSRLQAAVARVELGAAMPARALGGIAGMTLGVLSLLHLPPVPLCGAAMIAFGSALLFGSAAEDRVTSAAAMIELLVGLAAVALGIIALSWQYPVTLVLIGLLAVGASMLLGALACIAPFARPRSR